MKDQINSRGILMETGLFLAVASAGIFLFAKAAPGMATTLSALLDHMAFSFGQWIAGASFIH